MKNWNINKEKKLSVLKYLAGILLIFTVWWSIIIPIYPYFNASELIFLLIYFLTVSCVGLAYVILLLGRKTEQEKALKGQYQDHYMVIKNKINISFLNAKSKKTSIFDVLSILLEAQISHKNISVLIPDPEEFAQEVIDAYGKRPYGLLEVVDGLLWIILFLIFMYFFTWIPEFFFPDRTSVNRNIFPHTISVSTILLAILMFGNPIVNYYAHNNVRLDVRKIGFIILLFF